MTLREFWTFLRGPNATVCTRDVMCSRMVSAKHISRLKQYCDPKNDNPARDDNAVAILLQFIEEMGHTDIVDAFDSLPKRIT